MTDPCQLLITRKDSQRKHKRTCMRVVFDVDFSNYNYPAHTPRKYMNTGVRIPTTLVDTKFVFATTGSNKQESSPSGRGKVWHY